MPIALGLLKVSVKYTVIRGGIFHYQRAIPKALQDRYGAPLIRQTLNTSDPIKAAKEVAKLNLKYEREWAALNASPESSPESVRAQAEALLREQGLSPAPAENHPVAVDLFHDQLDELRATYAGDDPRLYYEAPASDYLSPVQVKAAQMLAGKSEPCLSDVLEHYLKASAKTDNPKFVADTRRVFSDLSRIVGDKPFATFVRDDGRAYIKAEVERVSTGTVRRRLNILHAAFEEYIRDFAPGLRNPLDSLKIPGEGKDAQKRKSFTPEDLARLAAACRAADDSLRWLLALMIDTGARIAEVVGLGIADIVLSAPIPHLVIQHHAWRTIKTEQSSRSIPLVGHSLWAATRLVSQASPGQTHAFPQYLREGAKGPVSNAGSASQAVNKWMTERGIDHTSHELRHTLMTRLRVAGCPKEIRHGITGHTSQDEGDRYGEGFGSLLGATSYWLEKIAGV